MEYHFKEVGNGQYTVEIDLKTCLKSSQITDLRSKLKSISNEDDFFTITGTNPLCLLKKGILTYRSETIFPLVYSRNKERILMVFGNPATISIKHGMFYFSNKGFSRHTMWSKLQEAGLIGSVNQDDKDMPLHQRRKLEAEERQKLILDGSSSDKYLMGLTTFYSFPTPVTGTYANVAGVAKLFRLILSKINDMEIDRILSYSFSKNATLVFVQKSTYDVFKHLKPARTKKIKRHIYWPAVSRKKDVPRRGRDLAVMLRRKTNCNKD